MEASNVPTVRQVAALETMPDFERAMERINAWYEQAIVDRPPVRFSRHNALYAEADALAQSRYPALKAWWYDEEYQIERFLQQLEGKQFLGETFPIFWPNLGPNVFAACYGCKLEFGEVTSWSEPILNDNSQPFALNWQSEYLHKLDSLTRKALEICSAKFLVGYTDLHPGIDWLAALRGSQKLCLDLYDDPDAVKAALRVGTADFLRFFAHFDTLLKARGQLSVSWMGIPSYGTMHIPSCDFATMISQDQFREFVLPVLIEETAAMTHNVFHMDGKGVARHLDAVLELPNTQAIQWVQGVGDDQPILQWVPLIRQMLAAGRSVVVDLSLDELEEFIAAVPPEGIFLCLPSEGEEQERAILERVARW